jgi:alpha-tubulin suppressor-like RCC1 family protein
MCGLLYSGSAYCWGENGGGNIGNGDLSSFKTAPVKVATSLTFKSVFSGFQHSCGITNSGAGYCWGYGLNGALGDGSKTHSAVPVAVAGGLTFSKISAAFFYTCGIASDGAYCWGRNRFGNLGTDTGICPNEGAANAYCPVAVPLKVSGPQTFVDISATERVACGLTASGAAFCWGDNTFGELGNGTSSASLTPTPVAVSGGLSFVTIVTGQMSVCAATADGTIYCWGRNNFGQIGQGTTTPFYTTPQRVNGIKLK